MADVLSERVVSELNTTPLIDVLLVLIVMLIMTIPVATHKVSIDLPNGPPPIVEVNPVRNDLNIDRAGTTRWNGRVVDDGTLRAVLAQAARMEPAPEVHFRPDADARYARVDEVLALAKKAQVAKLGFVGNGAFVAAF